MRFSAILFGVALLQAQTIPIGSVAPSAGAPAVTAVLTAGYSNARLGWQPMERVLTQSNITGVQFGVLCTVAMPDGGWVYHQPLIATGVGGQNLMIVATMAGSSGGGNHLYAFLEGDCSGTPIWTATLAGSTWNYVTSNIFYTYGVGVLSTPVIDLANGWVFCVSASGSAPTIQINKVRLSDGTILAQTTVDSSVQVPGVGCISGQTGTPTCTGKTDATSGSNLEYSPPWQTQRDALLLVGGNIYFGFGAGDENGIWHGWYLEYGEANPVSLQNAYVTTSGNGISTGANGGGIWPPGTGCSSDGTYIYCPAGNGTTDITTGGPDAGQTLLKLSASLAVVDYLTPGNFAATNTADADMDCRPMLLDSSHIACASKDACGWIAPTSNLGQLAAMGTTPPTGCSAGAGNSNQVWQIASVTPGASSGVYGGAYCLDALYYPVTSHPIAGFAYVGGVVTPAAFASTVGSYAMANLACSSNGPANGILWSASTSASAFSTKRAVTLTAYNPSTLAVINSWTGIGNASKWAIPTVDGDGLLFLPTDAGVVIFGLM